MQSESNGMLLALRQGLLKMMGVVGNVQNGSEICSIRDEALGAEVGFRRSYRNCR